MACSQPSEVHGRRAVNSYPHGIDRQTLDQSQVYPVLVRRLRADGEIRQPDHCVVEPVYTCDVKPLTIEVGAAAFPRDVALAEEWKIDDSEHGLSVAEQS